MVKSTSLDLPWTESLGEQLSASSLPCGFLVTGNQGLGKLQSVYQAVQKILDIDTCSQHPDVLLVTPANQYIGIDEIRQVQNFAQLTPTRSAMKAIIINECHRLTLAAANALLKSLEEPSEDTIFWLITDAPYSVPATIRSRCRWIKIPTPPTEQAVHWLQTENVDQPEFWLHLAYGAPLHAKALASNEDNRHFVRTAAQHFTQWLQNQLPSTALAKQLWAQPQLGALLLLAFSEDALRTHQGQEGRVRFKKIATRLLQKNNDFSQHWQYMVHWRAFYQTVKLRPEQSSLLQLESGLINWARCIEGT